MQQQQQQRRRSSDISVMGAENQVETLQSLSKVVKTLQNLSISGPQSQEEDAPENTHNGAAENVDASSVAGDEKFENVDQFLRNALRNPRDRINILRMELDIQKFVQNPVRHQFEFDTLPTSYLRLAAHRVAQHYGLQTMVVDWNSPEGPGIRIVARKTPETKFPSVQLSDMPVCLPKDNASVVKFAIKQRPQKGSLGIVNNDVNNINQVKSVEERNEEYLKARARIFKTENSCAAEPSADTAVNICQHTPHGTSNSAEKKQSKSESKINLHESKPAQSSSTKVFVKSEREAYNAGKSNNRIAIFRDLEKDRNDPDYDRSYDRLCRHAKGIDHGAGLTMGQLDMQHFYNQSTYYNLELAPFAPQMSECAAWVSPESAHGYGPLNGMMNSFDHGYSNPHATQAMYLNYSQFTCPTSLMTYNIYQPAYFQQSVAQSKLYPREIQHQ